MTSTSSPSCLAARSPSWHGCRVAREAPSLGGSSSSWPDFCSAERWRASGSPSTASSVSASSGSREQRQGAYWSRAGSPYSAPCFSRQRSRSPTAPPASQICRLPPCWYYSLRRQAWPSIALAASRGAKQPHAHSSDSSRSRVKRRSSSLRSPHFRSASTSRATCRGQRSAIS